MGRAGIVLGLEVSRLARNNADWHRLLEICALTDTLICDEDGLYDPADFNDRLLLGLKGTMSEAELHFIRARLQRRASCPRPAAASCRCRCRSGWSTTRPARSCSTPTPACSDAIAPPVRHVRPHRLGARGRPSVQPPTGCCSRSGSAPARARASWPGCRCATGGCCAPCTTRATPARSSTAGAANPQDRRTGKTTYRDSAARAVDRADPRRPPRLHHLGAVRAQPEAARRPTPTRTAPTAPPAPPAKGPRCCKAWPSAAAAGGG